MSNITSKYGTSDSEAIRRSNKKTCYQCKNAYILMISEAIRCEIKREFIPNGGVAEQCRYYKVDEQAGE
jgi:hypothetical protein